MNRRVLIVSASASLAVCLAVLVWVYFYTRARGKFGWELDHRRCVRSSSMRAPYASEGECMGATYRWSGADNACTTGGTVSQSDTDRFATARECMLAQPGALVDNRCIVAAGRAPEFTSVSECLSSAWVRTDAGCRRGSPLDDQADTKVYRTERECLGTWAVGDKKCSWTDGVGGFDTEEQCLLNSVGYDAESANCHPHANRSEDVFVNVSECEKAHPPVRYAIDPAVHRCTRSPSGPFVDESSCIAGAWHTAGDATMCVQGGARADEPVYATLGECEASLRPSKYKVVDHKCVPAADGPHDHIEECVNASVAWNGVNCVPATSAAQYLYEDVASCEFENAERGDKKWSYANNKCVPAPDGTYSTARECRSTKYYVVPGTNVCEMARYGAVANHGLYQTRDECEAKNNTLALSERRYVYNAEYGRCEPGAAGGNDGQTSFVDCMDGPAASTDRPDAVVRRAGFRVFYITNRLEHEVWIALANSKSSGPSTHAEAPLNETGFVLGARQSTNMYISDSWSGRLWARTGCVRDGDSLACETGNCAGKLFCGNDSGSPPATLVEFTFDPKTDYFDLSVLDGYNVGVRITVVEGEPAPPNGKVRHYRTPTMTQCAINPTAESIAPDARTHGGATVSMPVALVEREAHENTPHWWRLRMDSDAHAAVICSCDTPGGEGCVSEKCKYGCSPINTRVCSDPAKCDPLCDSSDGPQPETHRTCDGAAHRWERGGRCYVERWPSTALGTTFPDMLRSQCGTLAYTWQFDDAAALRTVQHSGTAVDAPDYWIEFLPSATTWDIELQHNMSNQSRVWAYDPSSYMCRDIHDTKNYWKNVQPPATGGTQLDCLGSAPTTADVLDPHIKYSCDWASGFLRRDANGKTMAEALPTCYKKRMRCSEDDKKPYEVWDPLEERDTLTPDEANFACATLSSAKRYRCNAHTGKCDEDPNGVSMYECARQCANLKPDACIRDATFDDDPTALTNYGPYVVKLPVVEGDNTAFCTKHPPCVGNRTTGDGYCQLDMSQAPCDDPSDPSKPCPRCRTNRRCVLPSHTFPDGTHCYDEYNKTTRPDMPCCNGCLS